MVECLPEVEAQPQPLLWCPSGDKSVVLLKFSLLLPDPSTCQWEVNWFQWSLIFHFPDSFSSSPQKNAVLCHSVSHCLFTWAVHVSWAPVFLIFQGIILDKDILETTIRFISFPGFPDYQDATYQLIIFSIGQWTTSLPQFVSFLSFGSFGSLLLIVLLLGKVYHFVAMPYGLATSLSGFTSLVKEVRKVGFEVGHLSAHVTTNWLIRANSCQRLFFQLY